MAPARPLRFDPIFEAQRQWTERGWGEAADGMAAVTSVIRVQQIFMARVGTALRPHGLTFARYEVLMVLLFSRTGALPLNKLGSRLQVHPTSITNAVDRLEEQGLIRRVAHPTDRRTTLAELTPRGRQTALAATESINAEVFSAPGFPPESVTALVEILGDLRANAGDFELAEARLID